MVALAPAAWAHDQLVQATPADGSSVRAPSQVVLRFSGELLPVGNRVRVDGPTGPAATAAPVTDGPTLSRALKPGLPAGAYRVTWRAVSADGHPLSGAFSFSVTAPATANAGPTPEPTPEPTSGPTPEPTSGPTSEPSEAGTAREGSALTTWLVVLGTLAVGLVVAAVRALRQGRA